MLLIVVVYMFLSCLHQWYKFIYKFVHRKQLMHCSFIGHTYKTDGQHPAPLVPYLGFVDVLSIPTDAGFCASVGMLFMFTSLKQVIRKQNLGGKLKGVACIMNHPPQNLFCVPTAKKIPTPLTSMTSACHNLAKVDPAKTWTEKTAAAPVVSFCCLMS